MIQITWRNVVYECDKAVHGPDYILMYDESLNLISKIFNISKEEWKFIEIFGGDWSDPSDIPTNIDQMQADIDFLSMMNDALEEEVELDRADIDYCLMLLGE